MDPKSNGKNSQLWKKIVPWAIALKLKAQLILHTLHYRRTSHCRQHLVWWKRIPNTLLLSNRSRSQVTQGTLADVIMFTIYQRINGLLILHPILSMIKPSPERKTYLLGQWLSGIRDGVNHRLFIRGKEVFGIVHYLPKTSQGIPRNICWTWLSTKWVK